MWGNWGRLYWGRKEERAEGVVVLFAWVSSDEKQLDQFVKLYGLIGWNSLVCHADFLTLYFPEKSTSLASAVLQELVMETKIRPAPIVFAAFSNGPKTCMYKVLQIIDGKVEAKLHGDDCRLIRDSLCGQIYDSGPTDFISDSDTQFAYPTVQAQPPRAVSWMARSLASGLDTLFPNKIQDQRAEYWHTLFSSVSFGPILIFCSEGDGLALCSIICNFTHRLRELGGDVNLVKWVDSPHLGHLNHHPDDYKSAVTELFGKTTALYRGRMKQLNCNGVCEICNRIPDSICSLHEVATSSNESLRRPSIEPFDHLFLPSSLNSPESKDGSPSGDKERGGLFDSENPPGIDAHGVLGKILFDVCIPKNVEGWDVKPAALRQTLAFNRRHGRFNPTKLLRRSKL